MTNGRKRQPVNLILANGKHHFSRKELDERRARELNVPFKDIKPPKYLTPAQKRTFTAYAKKLVALDIFTELDVDVLAQYAIALELYTKYSAQIVALLNDTEASHANELRALTTLQDKAFKQCLACARELGLSITSRAKIEVPPPADGGEDDEL